MKKMTIVDVQCQKLLGWHLTLENMGIDTIIGVRQKQYFLDLSLRQPIFHENAFFYEIDWSQAFSYYLNNFFIQENRFK